MTEPLGRVMHAALASRRRMLSAILVPISAADVSDDAVFADCIAGVLAAGIPALRLATEAKVSIPTVDRWSRGVSSPYPTMRPTIKDLIERIVRGEIAGIDSFDQVTAEAA